MKKKVEKNNLSKSDKKCQLKLYFYSIWGSLLNVEF